MALGYAGKLYILAFDHRESFRRDMFGIAGDPTPEQLERIRDAKELIFEGALEAVARGADPAACGIVVDEGYGADIPARARERGLKLAIPVERSGQDEFELEYGEEFGAHIARIGPDFAKVLVRHNPEDPDPDRNPRQRRRLKAVSDWLRSNERKLLFELQVPPTAAQLAAVAGDRRRYDRELRPALTRAAMQALQDGGIEVDAWKVEGVETTSDAAMLAGQARSGPGREDVACTVLGRAGSDEEIDAWLAAAAPVAGFAGFAIGRSIWWGTLKAFLLQSLARSQARDQIAANYLRFMDVYERHEAH